MRYFLLLYIGYLVTHSWLAAPAVKDWTNTRWRWSAVTHRRIYNGIAVLGLIPVLRSYFILPAWPLWQQPLVLTVLGWLIVLGSLGLMYRSFRPYDTAEFIGLRPPEHAAGLGNLSTDGLNAYVRHPLYTGILLFFWGNVLRSASGNALVLAVVSTIYLYVGAKLEERKLEAAFGEEYRRYRARTPMLWPRFSPTRTKRSAK